MRDQMHVKPAPGLVVRDPETKQPLAPEGEWKPRSTYWLRRVNEGDVTVEESESSGVQESTPPTPQLPNSRTLKPRKETDK